MQHGSLRNSPGVSFSAMRILGSFALVFLTRGGGRYQLGDREPLPCRAGDVLVIFPEIAHGYGPEPGGVWDECYLVFEGPVFDLWRQAGWLSADRAILSPRPTRAFLDGFRKIASTNSAGNPALDHRRICELQAWLSAALLADRRRKSNRPSAMWPPWMSEAVRYMQEHPVASLEKIAAACKLSEESFRKKFRAVAGVSPIRYRDGLMVAAAKKLIYEERLGNKEIADRLGLCDEFHFSKRFRQIAGLPPSEFRRGLKQLRD